MKCAAAYVNRLNQPKEIFEKNIKDNTEIQHFVMTLGNCSCSKQII